jgi:putative ubiquitin-RnfH superfamily antitoxin RatB of RatAB toxin-antitoxin module
MARGRVNIFNELKQALEEVQEYRQGKRTDLRVTMLAVPKRCRRERFGESAESSMPAKRCLRNT